MQAASRTQGLQTQWHGTELLVLRDGQETQRLPGTDIERVILAHQHGGHTPGDLAWALIELKLDAVILPPHSGIAGRIHFEHQAFWAQRPRVYWVVEKQAPLPWRLRPADGGLFSRWRPACVRVPRQELAPLIAKWPLQGPQSWEQRKWEHIQRTKLFAPLDAAMAQARKRDG
jgi:hypothetical protein